MKLVELLARELSEWPEKASHAVQYSDGGVGFTYGGKPGRDKDHSDWSINALTASEKAYWLIGVAKSISTIASDHATAIVTRSDWEAERARIAKPAKKAGKDGWIRHRGGKAPVSDDVFIDVRYRDGEILKLQKFKKSEAFLWAHHNGCSDIMAYRLHKPAEHVEPFIEAVQAFNALAKVPQLDGPLQWRDRITEIDATTQALTAERADLVQKLAGDGFALIGRAVEPVEPVEDMSDWRNWKVGDIVECVSHNERWSAKFAIGSVNVIKEIITDSDVPVDLTINIGYYVSPFDFKWHSRPSA